MTHESEFTPPRTDDRTQSARDLAACYARVFTVTDDGKRVLADLRAKFGLHRLVFIRNERGQIDVNGGMLRDGERRVMAEIENALQQATENSTKP